MTRLLKVATATSQILASAWLGFMLTAILHTGVPLQQPAGIWILTSCCIWALTQGEGE